MIALLGTVLSQARTHLNDDEGSNWPDNKLIPKAQQAFNQMQAELLLAGIPIINSVSVVITVPVSSVDDTNQDLSKIVGYPTDMIMPIEMKERQLGQRNQDFVDMMEVDYIPQSDIQNQLLYWSWISQTIMLRGALQSNQVLLKYQRLLPIPTLNTDSTIVILSELYLSYKVAAIASFSNRSFDISDKLNTIADTNLEKIVAMNVKQLQDLPTKRRPYHRGFGRSVIRSF